MTSPALENLNLNDTPATDGPAMTLTPLAHAQLAQLLAERKLTDHGLRVFVSGGGCSGLQYGMALEAAPGEYDTVVDQNGVKLFIDPTSLMYLSGASIDYVETPMASGFKLDNPNTAPSCGCGSGAASNEMDDEAGTCGCGGSCGCSH